MINPEVDKNIMPDGSAHIGVDVVSASDLILPTPVNGEVQESPLDAPESPEDKGIIRCICGIEEDDGFTIFCDRCSVWQHGACVGIYDVNDAPDKYLCDQCNPRPLDVQRAIRHQRDRQEAERENRTKKRRASNHPKNKVNSQNTSSLGPNPSFPPPQNRKEKHPSPPRRTEGKRPRTGRGQSTSNLAEPVIVQEEVDVVNDEELDIPVWPVARDYDFRDRNEISPDAEQFIEQRLQQLEKLNADDLPPDIERYDSIRDYERKTLRQPISKPATSSNFVRPFGLFAAEPMNENDLITEYTGLLGLQWDYKRDAINQFSRLQRPKQYVLFAPSNTLDLYIDARLSGNDARYVRRSCRPNARVGLVCVSSPAERGIHFALFATRNIKTREEITIGYDWNRSNKLEELLASIQEETKPLLEIYSSQVLQNMVTYASTVLGPIDCACSDDSCTFVRLRKALITSPSRRDSNGEDTMSLDQRDRSSDPEATDIEDDSRPNSRGTGKPPLSRDRTPSKESLIDNAPKTSREQRKIEQAMARFAQMEERERERTQDKRKKSDAAEEDTAVAAAAAAAGGKRRRQGSLTGETTAKPGAVRVPSGKGRGVKRKSMSPSPGVDRISESGVSLNESPKPSGRIPNRVKRSMKGRKEPINKKVRVQPPQESDSMLPKWVKKPTLSENWTPPQMLWFKKFAEIAKRGFEEKVKMEEVEVTNKAQESTPQPQASPVEAQQPPARTTPNLHVALPPSTLFPPQDLKTPLTSATPTLPPPPQTSYFPLSASSTTSTAPPASPLVAPSTPKVKLSLADYRARRASGMVTPSTPVADPLSHPSAVGESFIAPPPPSQMSASPEQKPKELPPS